MLGNVKDFDLHDSRQEVTSRPCEIGLTPVDVAAIAGLQGLGMLLRYAPYEAREPVEETQLKRSIIRRLGADNSGESLTPL